MSEADDLPLASLTSVIELIGPYAVERELGGGATGRVLACRDQDLGRDVAIKILHDELLSDDTALARFKREGQVLAKLDSPHVVRVFQVGVHGRVPYIVMERVDGKDAEATLRDQGALPIERVVSIGRDVAEGLAAVHAAGVLHRDVKPSNILLSSSGAKLGDFGLAATIEGSAQLTQVGTIPGTPATMAPERLRNECDERSDLYALGCTLYALASGKMPFERGSAIEVLAAHAHEPAPRLSLDHTKSGALGAPLADLVDRLLYKSPEQRPQSAAEVARVLEQMQSAPARRQEQEKREQLARKLEVLLGPEGEVPKLPEVPAVDELVPVEPPVEPPVAPPVAPVTKEAPAAPVDPASVSSDALPFVSAKLFVPPAVVAAHPPAAAAGIRERWPTIGPRTKKLTAAVVGVAALAALATALALALGGSQGVAGATDIDDVAPIRQRIDDGEARAVLAELDALERASQKPVHHLLRGHALSASGDRAGALLSYQRAAEGGVVDTRALELGLAALSDEEAEKAIALLVAWPTDEVAGRLAELIDEDDWWPRHHALTVLDGRKQSERIDVTAIGVKDLRDGPTCNKRKHGLTILKERGRGKEALAAIEEAQRRRDNGCIWFGDWDAARRAIRAR